MADHQGWLVADIAESGDADTVLDTVVTTDPENLTGHCEESRVIIYDDGVTTTDVDGALETVCSHLDRVLIVESIEGGNGATRSRYYQLDDGEFDGPTDSLHTIARWFVEAHFDYYAARYGMDSAI